MEALWWLFLNILSIIILSFYSMSEMACVSFNKVRLQYYVSKGMKRAIWLNYLLHHPTRLFGTTLIGVNIALVSGSEFSREFHRAIGVSPDLAPLTQVIIVVIFGELAPMFAARRYAEHVALLSVPLLYISAKIVTPFLWCLQVIANLCNYLIGKEESQTNIFLTQDELQKILEEIEEEDQPHISRDDFNAISTNIFNLPTKDARQVMEPITTAPKVSSNASVNELRGLFSKTDAEYFLIYQRELNNIVGIAFPRNYIRAPDNKKVREFSRPPWFIIQTTNIVQILKQFRHNNQSVAIVIDNDGGAIGVIHLYDIMEEIFGKSTLSSTKKHRPPSTKQILIERTLPGDMKVSEFNSQFNVLLSDQVDLTLSELLTKTLEHHPEVGESVFLDPFELTVKESSILEVKSVTVKTWLK